MPGVVAGFSSKVEGKERVLELVGVGWRGIFSSPGTGVGMGRSCSGWGSLRDTGMGKFSVFFRVAFASGSGDLTVLSLNGSPFELVGETLMLPEARLRVLSLGGVFDSSGFRSLSGVVGGDVPACLELVEVAPSGDTGEISDSDSMDDVLPSLLSGRCPVVLRRRGGGDGGGVLNLTFFSLAVGILVSDTTFGFGSDGGVPGAGEIVSGLCTSAVGGGRGACSGMGGGGGA